jgi:phosphatidylglycerol---prolipoprotein diacylglyceryl transferase
VQVIYTFFVAIGIVGAFVFARLLPPDMGVPSKVREGVRIYALIGAVLGAYLFELPADLCGWAAPAPASPSGLGDGHGGVFLGRTVLGGLLGGWLAVELKKRRMHYTGATGDGFAVPLAWSLTMGRLGCWFAGCCQGTRVSEGSLWAKLPRMAGDSPRFPASLLEAYFHACSLLLLLAGSRWGWFRGRRLALYLVIYATFRVALESQRENPKVLLGLTYYQCLALPLFALAGGTFARRTWTACVVRRRTPSPHSDLLP